MESVLYYPREVWRWTDILESKFDETRALPWMNKYWWMSFVFSGIYLLSILIGRRVMRDRKPFDLRVALCMWSTGLAMFSIFACFKIWPMFYNLLKYGGFEHTVCDMMYIRGSNKMGIWAWLFPLSKLPELFDTAFIILRKSKLPFLHWYHHISVFIYCWYSYAYPISTGVWFGSVNYTVHAIMYSYYAVKASGRNPPRFMARMVTLLQLSQMFIGLYLNFTAIRAVTLGKVCRMDWFTVGISVFFYASYAILFANFYYWTYIYKKPSSSNSKKNDTTKDSKTLTTNSEPNKANSLTQYTNGHINSHVGGSAFCRK